MLERIPFLRKRPRRPARPALPELNQSAIEQILAMRCGKETFEVVEDIRRDLASGVEWRRRRLAWSDVFTGEDLGLCVNQLRTAHDADARIRPSIAMSSPGLVDFDSIEYAYWQTVWAAGALRQGGEGRNKSPRLFLNMRALTCAPPGAPRGPWEDLQAVQNLIRRGEWSPERMDLIPTMSPTLREEGEGGLEVARYLPASRPSWLVQADSQVLAACAGGYFLNFPEEYEDGLSALHQPIGALYENGHLHMPPWLERPCAVEWRDGARRIELLGPENIALAVNDHPMRELACGGASPGAPATAWRNIDGELPPVPPGARVVDLVFSGAGLAAVVAPCSRQPPIGGAVVRLSGDLAAPWLDWLAAPKNHPFPKWRMSLVTSRNVEVEWAMAAGPRLLADGRAIPPEDFFRPWAAGEFRRGGPPPTRFPYDADRTRGPRTALGITHDEDWLLVVVDGRTDMAHSVGLTLEELSRLMRSLGCVHALNLDGGGSAVMSLEGISQLDQLKPGLASGVVNIPSDPGSRERIIPVSLTIVQA